MTVEASTTPMNPNEVAQKAGERRERLSEGAPVLCIDDRYTRSLKNVPDDLASVLIDSGVNSGPQVPGSSSEFIVLLAETAPEDVDLNMDQLFEIADEAHKREKISIAVHADDHHGHMTDDQIFDLLRRAKNDPTALDIPGCGAEGIITGEDNGFNLVRSSEFFRGRHLTSEMVARGARIMFLADNHADADKGEALAVTNLDSDTVFDRKGLEEAGIKVYGHTPAIAGRVVDRMAEVLSEKGQTKWADNLTKNGKRLEREHYQIAAKKLTGREPVEIA